MPDDTQVDPNRTIAALRQELVARTAERDEALAQQAAISEVLQITNASAGDLAPVFDAILEKAHALCEAPLGSLVLYDSVRLRAVATRGYPQEYDALARAGFSPTEGFMRLRSGERFVQHADSRAAGLDDEHPMKHAARDIAGVRCVLFVPLRKDGALLGYISAQRKVVSPFSEKQIALLQNFAAQAVIAMENARLLTETREALEQQTATAEVLQVINSSPGDLAPVFDAILENAHTLCGAAHGDLTLADGDNFRAVAVHGHSEAFADRLRQGAVSVGPNSPSKGLLEGARFVQIPDLGAIDDPISRAAFELGGIRTALFIPLRKDGILLGRISATRQEVKPFTEKEIGLLESFAAQAVIAIENARLLNETKEALERQTATSEVLRVISSSPGELEPVFQAMLEN